MVWIGISVVLYFVVVALVYLMQDSLLFPGARRGSGPLPAVQGVTTSRLSLPDGTRIRMAYGEPAGKPEGLLLFFVGNGEDLRSGMQWAGELTGYGVATIVTEYPGYGESEGKPSLETFLRAAEGAGEFAAEKARELGVPLLVGGSSLGTFSAVHLASRGVGTRLLLLAPPTSTVETGSRHYPWLPVRYLMRNRFDNLGPAADVTCPALVVHGDVDRVVPVDMGRRVAEALRGEFVLASGHDHTSLPLSPMGPYAGRIRAFLLGG